MNNVPQTGGVTFAAFARSVAIGLAFAAQVAPFRAQVVPEAKSDEAPETIVLSPFVIQAETETGYRANSTLAGTRLKTNLADVAASVQVVTPEFLRDVGATNFEDVLVLTTSTEVAGVGGNFSDANRQAWGNIDAVSSRSNPQGATRVRGLSQADLSQDYFSTGFPTDAYNVESIEISRGPNAALFGLGRPGGIINSTLKRARFDKMATQVEHKFDQWGTQRVVLDHNQPLIDDTVALRVVGLYMDERYEQESTYNVDKRLYADLQFRLFNGTSLRIAGSTGSMDGNRPVITPPADMISEWWVAGKPEWNPRSPNNAAFTPPGRTETITRPGLGGNQRNFVPVFDTAAGNQAVTGYVGDARRDVFGPTLPAATVQLMKLQYSTVIDRVKGVTSPQETAFYWPRRVTDRSIFDYRKYNLVGDNKEEDQDFSHLNVTGSQLFFGGNAGVELSYYREETGNLNWGHANDLWDSALFVDFNRTLQDGSPNPNFGRPYTGGVGGYAREGEAEGSAYRATGFARFDFTDKTGLQRFLGRHILTGLYTESRADNWARDGWDLAAGEALNDFYAPDFNDVNNNRRSGWLSYVGPSLADRPAVEGAGIRGITTRFDRSQANNALLWSPTTRAFERATIPLIGVGAGGSVNQTLRTNNLNRVDVESQVAVLQSFFLSEAIVTTVAWRKDEATQYSGSAALLASGVRDPSKPVLDGTPVLVGGAEEWSYGVVAKVPKRWLPDTVGLTLHFNKSSNFQPAGAQRNIFNEELPFPGGETEEYGLTLSLFANKLQARVNFYETAETGRRLGNPAQTYFSILNNVYRYNTAETLAAAGWQLPPQATLDAVGWEQIGTHANGNPEFLATRSISDITNTVSDGMEIELTYNPLRNWRIALNVAKAEAVSSGSLPALVAFRDQNDAYWNTPAIANLSSVDGGNDITFRDSLQPWMYNAINQVVLQDGGPTDELREWRWNAVTHYDFQTDNWLKGVGIGAAARWQDKVAVGYPIVTDPELGLISDVSNPIMGPSEFNLDAWVTYRRPLFEGKVRWAVRVGVKNITSDDGLIPMRINPDGQWAEVRIREATMWEISNTFDF